MAATLSLTDSAKASPLSREFAPRALVGLFLFHALVQVLVLGTGLLHLPLSGAAAWCMGLIAFGVAMAAFQYVPAATTEPATGFCHTLAAACLLLLGVYGLLAWLKTDPSFDGNWYHIPVIHFWALKGYVSWVNIDPHAAWFTMGQDYMNGYPNAHEVTSFWLARLVGDPAVNAASVLYLPLGALGVHVICRALGVSSAWGAFGALLYLLLPVNIAQVHTTYVDSSFAACVVGLLALMSMLGTSVLVRKGTQARDWSEQSCHTISPEGEFECLEPDALDATGKTGRYPFVNHSLLLPITIGAALGLIAGIKGNGPLVALLAGAWLAAHLCFSARNQSGRAVTRPWRNAAAFFVIVAAAAVLTGGYWNLRNWYIGGSPVYPIGITLGGVQLFPGEPFEKIVNTRGQTPPEMRDWPAWKQVAHTWMQGQSVERWHGALGDYASRFGGLSYLWLLGALPASLVLALRAVWQRIRKQGNNAAYARAKRYLFLFSFVFIIFLLTPNNWWARYTVWIFGIGLPAFICCAARPMPWRALSVLKWCWVLACCGVFFYEAGVAATKVANATPPFWKPTEGTTYWKPPADSPYARMLAEPDAPVALYNVITRRQSILGTLCQPIGLRPVYFLSEEDAAHPATLENFIRERGIRFLIAGEKGRQPAGIGTLAPEKQFARLWNLNVYAVKSP